VKDVERAGPVPVDSVKTPALEAGSEHWLNAGSPVRVSPEVLDRDDSGCK
jgi:hypothetical protein